MVGDHDLVIDQVVLGLDYQLIGRGIGLGGV